MELIFGVLTPLAPFLVVWVVMRHGPFRNRWWRGENPFGFAVFVGTVAFALGFFGPLLLFPGANQGPLLGIFYTGPLGLVGGFLWGLWRRRGRQA